MSDEADISQTIVCTICLGAFESGQKLRVTDCKHKFHMDCFDEWIIGATKFKCPNCNQILEINNKI